MACDKKGDNILTTRELITKRNELRSQILDMEFKNFFVKAFLRFMSSKEFKNYMIYKNKLMCASSLEESAILIKKINYLEEYGAVSDYLYLLSSCDDITLYLNLKSELDLIELRLVQEQKEQINLVDDKRLVKIK